MSERYRCCDSKEAVLMRHSAYVCHDCFLSAQVINGEEICRACGCNTDLAYVKAGMIALCLPCFVLLKRENNVNY